MAKLIKICTHQRMAQYFLNNYNKHLISFPISKKNYDVFVWNNKYCYYKKIEDQQSIEQKIINLIVNTFESLFDRAEYDYKIAFMNSSKDEPSTIFFANQLKELSKNLKHVITFIENIFTETSEKKSRKIMAVQNRSANILVTENKYF